MEKQTIGKWNGYSVVMNKADRKVFWTVEKRGAVHNRFNDPESFGHWVYHSGFRPEKGKAAFKVKK